jgi:hypothetical protein
VGNKKKKEDIQKAPVHKRVQGQQEGRPRKQARTETAGNQATLDAEDSMESASHSALEEIELQGFKKTFASPHLYKCSPGLKVTGQSQQTTNTTAGTVVSPPKAAASWSVPNIEKNDSICTTEHGWVQVIGYSLSSPLKGNHPALFQI